MAASFKKDRSFLFSAISMVALILLFGITTIILSDATSKSYLALNESRSNMSDSRIATGYISTKIRLADRAGAVEIKQFEGGDAIVLSEEISGEIYDTWIYAYKGYLTETLIGRQNSFSPEFGFPIVKIKELRAEAVKDGCAIQVGVVSENGELQELYLSLRSAR